MVPSSFSAATAYRELFRRVVLDVVYGQMPKSLRRAPMVLKLAESLIERQSVKIAADDEALHHSGLLDDRTGQRSRDYQLLLSAEILAERLEEYVSYVSFVDPRFLAFVAAASMPLERLNQLVSGLSQRSTGFPLALTVAAFLLIRALDALQPRRIWDCIKDLASHREAIFIEMSLLDRDSFLAVFECGIISERHLALSVVDSLILAGEPSLAADAAHLVATLVTEDLDVLEHAHFLRARALYEIDDRSAEDELSFVKSKKAVAALGLQAEICSSRGNFPQARNAYEALLERITSLDLRERADILCGLAYVLGKVGESEQAETRFQEAIGLLQPLGDSQLLAETLSCQGQFLSESNRPSEARKCLLKSLTMNQRLGILVGIGIVEGLLGDLDLVEGDVAAAEVRLNKSLEIALRVGNRWREAWVLGRIGKVYMAKGQIGEATSCLRESQKLFDIIGSTQQ
jgi:tetratricopeptide (TPR) repeat protein